MWTKTTFSNPIIMWYYYIFSKADITVVEPYQHEHKHLSGCQVIFKNGHKILFRDVTVSDFWKVVFSKEDED